MATQLQLPSGIRTRIRKDVRRRTWMISAWVALVVTAVVGLECLVGLGLDRYLLLSSALRRQAGMLLALPAIAGLLALGIWLIRSRVTARDLRRLDNPTDDMRAAMNLVERVRGGESHLALDLVEETVRRASDFVAQPLPSPTDQRRRLRRAGLFCGGVLMGLAACRLLAPDLHTGISRYLFPELDFGSVGDRKFHVQAEVWGNQSATPPGDTRDAGPRKLADVYFLRERREHDAWTPNFDSIPTTSADVLAGYNPLAIHNREVSALEGDRLVLRFQALDRRGHADLDGLSFVRFEGDRQIQLRYLKVDNSGTIGVDRLRGDFDFQLRAADQFSPRYHVRVTQRPTPSRIYLFQRQPAQYGKATREIVIRDRAAHVNQNRISGLPGSRLAVELATPYGADLDPQASYAMLGEGKRLKLRFVTSRNPQRRARGEKLWTFDFTLDERIDANARLQLHLVTKQAQFQGRPITNQYDEPLLVHVLEDLPPAVEFTMLPEKRHFAADEPFAFRYHYTDDYGVAEVGLEIQYNPNLAEVAYLPIDVRGSDEAGEMRREDELLHVLDLKPLYHNFANFSIVVKDVKGQTAKTGLVTLTTSDNFTETLLPKLTGGWNFYWPHAPTSANARPGDLETTPASLQLGTYRKSLAEVRNLLDGKRLDGSPRDASQPFDPKSLAAVAAGLVYRHTPYLINGQQPFAYHHRDYPNYFQRQASAYLSALAALDGERLMTDVKRLVEALAVSPDPFTAPEFEQLKAQRELVDRQSALAELVSDEYAEISLRASLLRVAYFSETIGRRLSEADRLLDELQSEAGPAPADSAAADPWQSYPQWVMTRHPDYNLRERARLLTLLVRNINGKLEALRGELEKILTKHRAGLDSRLVAMLSMVSQFGSSAYDVDRQELASKAALLARFIRQGVLAAESDVYQQIAGELPTCIDKARQARRRLPEVAQFTPRLTGLRSAAQALSAADLLHNVGEPTYPETVNQRTRDNRRSRLRSELEQLTTHLGSVLLAEEFQTFQNLTSVRSRLLELRGSIAAIRAELADWPQLKERETLLAAADDQAAQFLACVEAVAKFQADLGTLAGFQSVFAEDGLPDVQDRKLVQSIHDALAEIAGQVRIVPEAQAGERLGKLDAALTKVEASLTALAALPVWTAPQTRTLATAPHPKISVASSKLFDTLRSEEMLVRLDQDLKRYGDRPEMQDAVFEVAADYFANVPIDTAKDALANPVEEYLNARVAAAFYVSSLKTMQPFAETFARDGNDRKPWLKEYFQGRDLPQPVVDRIDQTNYAAPELPPELAELGRPYLEAYRANQLPQLLRTKRQERLPQLMALAAQVREHVRRYEALVRVGGLNVLVTELQDNVRLLRYASDDVRTENLWNEAAEQAEGLDRDLLAGRLADIPPEARQALRERVHVFRQPYPLVLASSELAAALAAYQNQLRRLEDQFTPVVQAAEAALRADAAALQQDLALVILSSFQAQYWFERQLELDLLQKQVLLGNLTGKERISAFFPMGSMHLSVEVMKTMNLAAYGWRSICNLRAVPFAAEPTDERRNAFLHDCSTLTVLKVLPEYYFDNHTGVIALRGFAAIKACDAVVELMLEQVRGGRKIQIGVIDYLVKPQSAEPVTRDQRMLDLVGSLQVTSTLFQMDADMLAYQQIRQAVESNDPTSLRQAVQKIRTSPASLGQFWRRVARPLADYLDLGQPLMDAETFAALPAEAVRQRLEQQQTLLQQSLGYVNRLGSGLDDAQRAELEVLSEALAYDKNWLAAIDQPSAAANDSFQPGYRDVHEAVVSLLRSIEGSLFPAEPSYPPRLRYKHALFHFGHFNFNADVQNAEQRWFNRADKDYSLVFGELLALADGKLGGEKSDPAEVVMAFSRFIDSKYRYLMAFNTPNSQYERPVPRIIIADESMPEHLGRALNSALTIDLPEQDNRLIRQLYFEALQDARSGGESAQP